MQEIVTIEGKQIIEVYQSSYGDYWYITEKLYKQDTVIDGTVYRDDQILFGYAILASCPECAEFGNISETELTLLGNYVRKVPRVDWHLCPDVEVKIVEGHESSQEGRDNGATGCSGPCAIEPQAIKKGRKLFMVTWNEYHECFATVEAESEEEAEEKWCDNQYVKFTDNCESIDNVEICEEGEDEEAMEKSE